MSSESAGNAKHLDWCFSSIYSAVKIGESHPVTGLVHLLSSLTRYLKHPQKVFLEFQGSGTEPSHVKKFRDDNAKNCGSQYRTKMIPRQYREILIRNRDIANLSRNSYKKLPFSENFSSV